jgi:putative transposase
MELEVKRKKTTVSLINYHFVFCPRYRRKIFKNPLIEARFKSIVTEVCQSIDVDVISVKCEEDHTHLFLSAGPHLSPSDIVGKIKYVSSSTLRKEFIELSKAVSLWTRSFFVSTSYDTPNTTINNFINEQKKRG